MVAAAVVAAGALTAGAAAYSGSQAAKAQKNASNAANATESSQYAQTRTDNMPALNARNASLARLQDLLGISGNTGATGYGSLGGPINPGDVMNSPGYQFGLHQGQTTLNNQEVARGMSNSGQALKAADQFGTDYATTKYDDAFNREVANRSAQLNPLQSAAQLGQTGASTVAQAGTNAANVISGNQTALGNAVGASYLNTGNAFANAGNSMAGWYMAHQTAPPPVTYGSNPNGYNGTMNNPSAYVGP